MSKNKVGTALSIKNEVSVAQNERAAIEQAIMLGSPSSLEQAIYLAKRTGILPQSDSSAYAWVAYEMARLVYPELAGTMPPNAVSPPDSPLVKAFIDARNGKQLIPESGAAPLFELLPALSIFRIKTAAHIAGTLSAVERFKQFDIPSAVADLAHALALEQSGERDKALAAYSSAEQAASDCYPAIFGKARIYIDMSKGKEALSALGKLDTLIETGINGRRLKARALYSLGLFDDAFPIITSILRDDPLDSQFALMRARILIERGEYKQAAPLLDAYASINPSDRLYILLRARLSLENSKDRGAALSALRRGLERYPDDRELMAYAAEILWDGDKNDKAEAVALAQKAIEANPASMPALKVLLASEIEAGNYISAAKRADSITASGYAFKDMGALFAAYRGAGRSKDAAKLAQEWKEKEPESEGAALAWIMVILENGDKANATALINKYLQGKGSPAFRSNLYWLQSRLQPTSDAALASLRSALLENGINVDALAAMSDLYVKKGDYQRAKFYLKQALTVAPERPDIIERRNVLIQLGISIP